MNGFEIFLCVLAGIILFFILVLSVPVHVYFNYGEKIQLTVRYAFVKLNILPMGQKKQKNPKKKKKAKDENEDEPDKEEKTPKNEKKPNPLVKLIKNNGFDGMMEIFSNLGSILAKYGEKLLRAFRFNLIEVHSVVGTGDAAGTAIKYGETCQKVYPVVGFICSHSMVRKYDIDISADFLANSSTGDFGFDFQLVLRKLINATVGMLVRMAFKVVLKFIKNGKSKSNADGSKQSKKANAISN